MEWSFGCASAHFALPPFRRLLPSLSHSNAGQRPVLLLILGWCTVPCGRCRGSVPSHRGTLIVTDPAPVEGSHGGAPAHLALRSSLRLVTRVNALRFCLSRLGPPPRVVVSGASMPPGYRPCVGSGFAAQVLGGWEPYLRSGSFLPAARFLVQRRDQRPVFLLIPPCCRSRVCCRHPSSNAGQRSVLLPILTGVLSRVAVVGEG